jgi:hypothetical protein
VFRFQLDEDSGQLDEIDREAGMFGTPKMRRPGDKTPEPPGGRAAERLRMFERARGFVGQSVEPKTKQVGAKRKKDNLGRKQLSSKKETSPHEEQNQRTD